MSAKCCAKPNVTTYSDGSGICQSCRTTFDASGEGTSASNNETNEQVAGLQQRIEILENDVSRLTVLVGGAEGALESLASRVLTLEGNVVAPS